MLVSLFRLWCCMNTSLLVLLVLDAHVCNYMVVFVYACLVFEVFPATDMCAQTSV